MTKNKLYLKTTDVFLSVSILCHHLYAFISLSLPRLPSQIETSSLYSTGVGLVPV